MCEVVMKMDVGMSFVPPTPRVDDDDDTSFFKVLDTFCMQAAGAVVYQPSLGILAFFHFRELSYRAESSTGKPLSYLLATASGRLA